MAALRMRRAGLRLPSAANAIETSNAKRAIPAKWSVCIGYYLRRAAISHASKIPKILTSPAAASSRVP
jgi:hypothetical protein